MVSGQSTNGGITSWPRFDFDSKQAIARRRSFAVRSAPPRKANFTSCTQQFEVARHCCVVEIDENRQASNKRSLENENAQSGNGNSREECQDTTIGSRTAAVLSFDLSYCSPVLDNSFIKRAKEEEEQPVTPPQFGAPTIILSPDVFASLSSPEGSAKKTLRCAPRRPNDLSCRTPTRNTTARALQYGDVTQRTVVLNERLRKVQCYVTSSANKRIAIPQQDSEAVVSFDVSYQSSLMSDLRNDSSQSLNLSSVKVVDAFTSTPQRSSTLDPFSSSESSSCSLSTLKQTPHCLKCKSDPDSTLFATSPVAVAANKEPTETLRSEIEFRASTQKSCHTDSTVSTKEDIENTFDDSIWLNASEPFSINSCATQTQAGVNSNSPDKSPRNYVSPVKTPPPLLQSYHSPSLATTSELDDVWERRAPIKTHRLSKLADALRRRLQMSRSDIAMWRCDDDNGQKMAMRIQLDEHLINVHWGVHWSNAIETASRKKILIVDSESISLKIQQRGNHFVDLYRPIVEVTDDSIGTVLLAPRYCKCPIIAE
uniref:SH2 domain-containing protein n=1 Tax=Ascaris lumbricoides TaxID=6252 RepID=A0A0M3I2V7_ASCLU